MKVLVIDNYDSFTYNLVHYIEDILGDLPDVKRNDRFSLEDLDTYDCLVVSPGPGIPDESGLSKAAITQAAGRIPILGVCLGHQAIGEVFGSPLKNLKSVHHGVDCELISVSEDPLYTGLEFPLVVGRYHSWVIDPQSVTDNLVVTATDEAGEIMSIRHKDLPIWGVQYHPESVLTPNGKQILRNFFEHCCA